MPKELEYMNFEQVADVVMGTSAELRTRIISVGWAACYEYVKYSKAEYYADRFQEFQDSVAHVSLSIEEPKNAQNWIKYRILSNKLNWRRQIHMTQKQKNLCCD